MNGTQSGFNILIVVTTKSDNGTSSGGLRRLPRIVGDSGVSKITVLELDSTSKQKHLDSGLKPSTSN